MRHTYFYVLQNSFPVQVVKEYVVIDIAAAPQQINETHPESKDSYKNAILSVYFYKKNSAFFVSWIKLYLKIKGLINSPDN
ncbi:TPR-repeat-containing protein [Bacillus cereus Rock4-18]|nr:TPR-repeat-containing protein [Bacillus cereus Rock4-18]